MNLKIISRIAVACLATTVLAGAAPDEDLSLADAVANFNTAATTDEIGAKQPPLTEGEVVARILDWNPRLYPAPPTVREMYRNVAEERRVPAGLRFSSSTGSYNGDHFITAWRVTLDISAMPSGSVNRKLGVGFSYPIRTQHIDARVLTDEEKQTMASMLEQAESARRGLTGQADDEE